VIVLVDTSVWVDHLRRGDDGLESLLQDGRVVTHPMVIGELACGALSARRTTLAFLRALPSTAMKDAEHVLAFIEKQRLFGRGLGWVDMNLLASAWESKHPFWTRDRSLMDSCRVLGLVTVE
jgi:hypothetical protein